MILESDGDKIGHFEKVVGTCPQCKWHLFNTVSDYSSTGPRWKHAMFVPPIVNTYPNGQMKRLAFHRQHEVGAEWCLHQEQRDDASRSQFITPAPGSFPSNESARMLTVSWSCYHPQSPIKPHELQWSSRRRRIHKVSLSFYWPYSASEHDAHGW